MLLDTLAIFDPEAFEKNLSSQSDSPLTVFKQAVINGSETLKQAFENGADTIELVHARSDFIDQILQHAFQLYFKDCQQSMALLAVGGYGRGELHPASDIDLMLLLNEKETEATRSIIEQFFTLLWDIKLDIGHSVRTLSECSKEAHNDITVATNIMESRLLIGDESLFNAMQQSTGPDQLWDSASFFQAKLDEQVSRHRKFHGTAYNLEPNIKENSGGLRDIQMIGWVAKRHFGAQTLQELVTHNFLTQREYDALMEGQTLLWRIRMGLHYATGRREDRLLFDLQRQLANNFGYEDGDNNLAIEQFMQRYYRTVIELERLNELLLQLFREEILYADTSSEVEKINNRFQIVNGYIEASTPEVFKNHPTALLEIFLIMELHPEITGVRAETIRLIREHKHLIDDKFRRSETAKQLFMEIIVQPRGVTHEMRRMSRYGILAAYLPAFEAITGRMQYDLFHAYTVDQHTLFVVRNLRRLSVPQYAHEFPLASGIFHHLPKPDLLYLAGLFHDIAKGRGGNHAQLGAEDGRDFCLAHGKSAEDSELVAWLIQSHLLMSMVAQRKDISDPEVVTLFAKQMGCQQRLDYLYLLTMCDIRATNPKQWNSWKDNLLSELYHKTSSTLRMGDENPVSRVIAVQETQTSAQRFLSLDGHTPELVNQLWQHFNDIYFLHHSPDEVCWHTKLILDMPPDALPLVGARVSDMGHTELFIYTHESSTLFYTIVSTIDMLGLDIVNAQLMATDHDMKLETFKVLEENGSVPDSDFRIDEIITRLKKDLSNNEVRATSNFRSRSRAHKHFEVETEVRMEQLPGKDVTSLSIIATDRPGLLADIAQAFLECDILIHNAKISTAGEKANDTFHITDKQNQPLLDEEVYQPLKQSIINHLNQ